MIELHYSDMSVLMRCGAQYELMKRYGKRPGNRFLIAGTGTHAAIELNMLHKMERGELAPLDTVSDAARDTVLATIERDGMRLIGDDSTSGLNLVRGETVDKAVRLSKLHYEKLAPAIDPVSVEREWRLDFTGEDARLAGRIDLEVADGIRDTKTASKTPPANAADMSDQLSMYALAYRTLNKRMPTVLTLDNLVDKSKPEALTLATTRTDADLQKFLRRIQMALKVIRAGVFMPCDRREWYCSPEWCGYYELCPYV